jgi:ornithine cyclodeaminase/alanine dehydrogenase
MDCVWITAMRTAAATAVAARRLARSDSAVLGILGCGVQGLTNTEALRSVLPIKKVIGYDVNREALHRFTGEVRKRFGLETKEAATPREAVTGCDIIVTAGPILKIPHATIQAGWMDEGAFASLVDFDSYWHPDAMKESDKFCTDDIDQLEHYRSIGYFQGIPPVYADLGELVIGSKPGRQDPRERTIACNLGLAIDDMAVAPAVYERAVEKGIGTRLPL